MPIWVEGAEAKRNHRQSVFRYIQQLFSYPYVILVANANLSRYNSCKCKKQQAWLCAIACGLNFLVALFGEGVFGTLRTRFVTLFSVVVYAGVQLQDESKQLFHKDYDLLLLEVGLLVSLFGLSAGYFQHATSKALTFCLFRFTFTFAVRFYICIFRLAVIL